ncbi:flagellar hook protein FlgE [Thiosulfatimonas sediminis]|uniref:Flagellar hook protein FlgE n=1 Tax=Thiosulfatimonas sediminis TaxID=2675054 RepID=A0A6F8PU23_9GAMM|nr:flagellar hook protein FlgE [Thiosulfatimonas sediminis]BBP45508.1 flagellar hook protein FlgE [Thiosulfatimonas sediminis]
MGVAYDLNALSGINAASTGLGVISNNLANSQSVGFKSSRAEFADMFSGPQNSPGNGVRVAAVTQDFTQGTIAGTGRELDMAIDGEGFFVLEDKTGRYDNVYTRNGSFKLDKDGFLTDQTGNKVQGFLLNENISTTTNPVFDTTLSSIDLDDLNKEPKATDEMTFDINLNGEADNNVDGNLTATPGSIDNSVGGTTPIGGATLSNIAKLTDFETEGAYGGFPDYVTTETIHDTLGGEHRLTANFYKRDVVTTGPGVNGSDLTYDAATDTYSQVATGTGDTKYTSWLVQYTMEDYDQETGQWVTSGHAEGATPGEATADGGLVYELRFDTNGKLIDVREPLEQNTQAAGTGGNINIVGQDTANTALDPASWVSVNSAPSMKWVVDAPFTGASDPLGNTADTTIGIEVDFEEMTQFAGSSITRGVTQNGYAVGDLIGLTTGLDGVIQARYSNGRSVPVAQVALANFADKNAMEKLGGQTYAETFSSGTRQLGQPQSVGLGTINAGSLEYSNVDVAGELVNMIQTQRTYQASAQVISTSQQLTQTILQL